MAKPILSPIQRWRKATLAQFIRDKATAKRRAKKAAVKAVDQELVIQWRALRKIGAYQSRETPSLSRLTRSRRAAIRSAYNNLQGFAVFEDGKVYRPLEKVQVERVRKIKTDQGSFTRTTKSDFYKLDKDRFTLLKKPPKKLPNDALRTSKGALIAHKRGERVRFKDGKLIIAQPKKPGIKMVQFEREPISGVAEILALRDAINEGRVKLKKNEGLRLYNFGWTRNGRGYLANSIDELAALITRYEHSMKDFAYWANASEIVHYTRGK